MLPEVPATPGASNASPSLLLSPPHTHPPTLPPASPQLRLRRHHSRTQGSVPSSCRRLAAPAAAGDAGVGGLQLAPRVGGWVGGCAPGNTELAAVGWASFAPPLLPSSVQVPGAPLCVLGWRWRQPFQCSRTRGRAVSWSLLPRPCLFSNLAPLAHPSVQAPAPQQPAVCSHGCPGPHLPAVRPLQ